MPRGKQSKGKCTYCGQELAKGVMVKHLSSCAQRQEYIGRAERKREEDETLYHLRVQDAYLSNFWLDLEMRGLATLKDLDTYLRAIWLECCGHLSRFSAGGWGSGEIPKKTRVDKVFGPGVELNHVYDFGTSSETLIKTVSVRKGKPTTSRPIALMARNLMPETKCMECDQPAAFLCRECLEEEDASGTLCNQHAQDHPHGNYGDPLLLVNSPRMGMCRYTGPAEPPY